jgi:molecular chaperone DnaJ
MVTVMACDTCRGEGVVIAIPCRECRGDGRVRTLHTLNLKIPAGIDSQSQLRMTGEGEVGPRGGPFGNLYVVFEIQPHAFFRRQENDILYEMSVNVAQAALGATLTIPTLEGSEPLKINAGMQSGTTFRLRGKGVPMLRANGRGDQIVIAKVVIPEKLTDVQRVLFTELAHTFEPLTGTNAGNAGQKSGTDPADEGILDRIKSALGL